MHLYDLLFVLKIKLERKRNRFSILLLKPGLGQAESRSQERLGFFPGC